MFEHDFEKIGSAVSTHSENLKGFGFSAKKLAENPKKMAGVKPQDPQLFGCMDFDRLCSSTFNAPTKENWSIIVVHQY